jgi:Fe-Mn family superoxide dismutase
MLNDDLIKKTVRNAITKITGDLKLVEESYVKEIKPFQLKDVESVSKRAFDEHMDLYKGYIDNLNKISGKLDTVDHDQAGAGFSDVRSLKIDEVFNLNGAYLHELYFNNCYDKSSKVYTDSLAHMRLEKYFGDFYKWQEEFISCGLVSREGWVVTGYSFFVKKCINIVVDSHNINVPVGFIPLIVVDMWSHTYAPDFGIDKKGYIQSQMKEMNWGVIEKRFENLDKILTVLQENK